MVQQFARLQLPNGQAAQFKWQEGKREDDQVRQAKNVKLFLHADQEVFDCSLDVLHVCREGEEVMVVDAKWITEVIAMVLFRHPEVSWNKCKTDEYFAVEKTFSNVVVESKVKGEM
ncbi:hypothetical protein PM082_023839 [Marasmius tenuissimus]|nr:hypothetical protein PM082_023839 [Marasmius tenuissimus]